MSPAEYTAFVKNAVENLLHEAKLLLNGVDDQVCAFISNPSFINTNTSLGPNE
jgi:hypothetical protein